MMIDIGKYAPLTEKIVGAAIEAHRTLGGPGLLEKVYETALCRELENAGLRFRRQCECPVVYKGEDIGDPDHPLRIDVLVENTIVVECKAVEKNNPVFAAQCLTYLRLMNLPLGLVINFGMPTVVQGVERVVNSKFRSDLGYRRGAVFCLTQRNRGAEKMRNEVGKSGWIDGGAPLLRSSALKLNKEKSHGI